MKSKVNLIDRALEYHSRPRRIIRVKKELQSTNSNWIEIHPLHDFVPAIPACYAVYDAEKLIYVGSTTNLQRRMYSYSFKFSIWGDVTPWGPIVLRLKYRPSKKHGDWAMVEIRLIQRLKPFYNVRHKD